MREIFDYPKQYQWTIQEILKIVLDVQYIITVNNYILARVNNSTTNINNSNNNNSNNKDTNNNNNNTTSLLAKDVSLCRISC